MKYIFFLLNFAFYILHSQAQAQNVGIGTTEPTNKLQVAGNILVSLPYTSTSTPPSQFKTITMINGGSQTFSSFDSTGRIFDPGGPSGNYLDNLNSTVLIDNNYGTGLSILIETIDIGSGDSLVVKDAAGTLATLLAFGAGNQATGEYILNAGSVNIIFKSNSDGVNGSGFSLLFKRLYPLEGQPRVTGAVGNAFYFDASKGILRSGVAGSSDKPGDFSTALGLNNIASGYGSTAIGTSNAATGFYSFAAGSNATASATGALAIGNNTTASGSYAMAMGEGSTSSGNTSTSFGSNNTASGNSATAMGSSNHANGLVSTTIGFNNTTSGNWSIAMGESSTASSDVAVAIGRSVTASGALSTAMGAYASTSGKGGAFVIGDNSTTTLMLSSTTNQMSMRFNNGYRLFSNSALTTGVTLASGGGSWTAVSDRRLKENFRTINNEELLQKVAALPITNWNYKSQPASQRHIGPMAQDFYAAFHLDGEGADTTINTMDISGVNMVAIQALEKRTADLIKENVMLKADNIEMKAALAEVRLQLKQMQLSLQPRAAER